MGSRKTRDRSPYQEGAEPCIWMTAGILSFKLCDRQFDCDSCPLDAALTGSVIRLPDSGPGLPEWTFPDDRRYGRSHLWVRPAGDGRLRVGIDALAAQLLARSSGVLLPSVGDLLRRGDAACTVAIAGGEVPLRSPVAGHVLEVNSKLIRNPWRLIEDPYGSGWVCGVQAPPSRTSDGLRTASETQHHLSHELRHFRSRLASYLVSGTTDTGQTMADGGEPLTDLRQILGRKSFLCLLQEFLA